MRLVFIGPPGAGKGTQAARVVEHAGIVHLSTGEMLRQARGEESRLGKVAAEYLDAGQLVPDEIIIDLIRERLEQPDCRGGYLLDDFPRTLQQAQALDELLVARGERLDAALYLQVDQAELERRLAARGREDDSPDVVRQRLAAFEQSTAPLREYYESRGLLQVVDGKGTPDDVFARIKDVLS